MAVYEPTSGRIVALCCVTCEKPFEHTTKSKGRYPRFCSAECRATQHGVRSIQRRPKLIGRTLHTITCAQCGVAFQTIDLKRKCCSVDCGSLWGKAQSDLKRAERSAVRNTRTCESCGKVFRRHRTSDPGRFCSRKCAATAARKWPTLRAAKKARKARYRSRRRLASGLDDPIGCAKCGTEFVRKQRHHRFCSDICRAPSATAGSPKLCMRCGDEFVATHGGQGFCGDDCRKAASRRFRPSGGRKDRDRARKAGVKYEPINRAKLYQRDGWRCQICGVKTPKRMRGKLVDNAPELDHRVPLARGGDHTWDNAQTACRRCNQAKGAHRVVGQMNLFAKP